MAIEKMWRRMEAKLEILAQAVGVDTNAVEWTEAGGFNPGIIGEEPDMPEGAVSATIETVQTVVPGEQAQPWDGYDDATVDEVVQRMAGMNDAQRQQVITYEQANKNRKGILS